MIKLELNTRCAQIADRLVPQYRDGGKNYSCHGGVARRWQAAFEGACIAFGHDPKNNAYPIKSQEGV
jgi:hypothetical protein